MRTLCAKMHACVKIAPRQAEGDRRTSKGAPSGAKMHPQCHALAAGVRVSHSLTLSRRQSRSSDDLINGHCNLRAHYTRSWPCQGLLLRVCAQLLLLIASCLARGALQLSIFSVSALCALCGPCAMGTSSCAARVRAQLHCSVQRTGSCHSLELHVAPVLPPSMHVCCWRLAAALA